MTFSGLEKIFLTDIVKAFNLITKDHFDERLFLEEELGNPSTVIEKAKRFSFFSLDKETTRMKKCKCRCCCQ